MKKLLLATALFLALLLVLTNVTRGISLAKDHDDTPTPTSSTFSISEITVSCSGSGKVYFSGTIPQGGFTLELMDKGSSGPFISTVPPTILTFTSGTSPISYAFDLTNWNAPHMRVDSNYNTKSDSLYCDDITPTQGTTPTPTEVTPTGTTDPTITATPTTTTTTTSSNGSGDGKSDGQSDGGSSCPECTQSHTQAVLGASTMAATGTFDTQVMNFVLLGGMLSMGAAAYAKAKKI